MTTKGAKLPRGECSYCHKSFTLYTGGGEVRFHLIQPVSMRVKGSNNYCPGSGKLPTAEKVKR